MSRIVRAVGCALFLLVSTGCFGGRPSGVATTPGDCYCELSEPTVTNVNGELRLKVHYNFPDGTPKYEAWYTCTFELQGTNTSSVTVRKIGSELAQQGDLEDATNAAFLRGNSGTLVIQVRQGEKKNGPFRPVSAPLVTDF